MKRFFQILLLALFLALALCLLHNPAKGGLSHNHNPLGLTSDRSQVYLLPSSQEYLDSLTGHIAKARKSIYVEMYQLGGVKAQEVMALMRKKAREGVKVQILVDGWGTREEVWDYDAIEEDGVEISFWDPVKFPLVNHILHRNHRKVIVIDDEWNFIGSTNIADYSFGKFPERPDSLPCFDMNVQFRAGAPQVRVVEKSQDLLSTLVALIDSAKDSIRIIQPYMAPPKPVRKALLNALERGVDIQFLMGEWNDIPVYQRSAFGFFHEDMGPGGACLWLFQGGFQHTKALSVDGSVLYLGSLNMTYRALKRNLEENVLVQDPKLAKEFDALFAAYAKESIPFDERYWDLLSKGERFRCTLAHRFNNLIIQ